MKQGITCNTNKGCYWSHAFDTRVCAIIIYS